jgi:hypothetical protein
MYKSSWQIVQISGGSGCSCGIHSLKLPRIKEDSFDLPGFHAMNKNHYFGDDAIASDEPTSRVVDGLETVRTPYVDDDRFGSYEIED